MTNKRVITASVVGLMLGLGLGACDVVPEPDAEFRMEAGLADLEGPIVVSGEDVEALLGEEAALEVEAALESVPVDADAALGPNCECTMGAAYLRVANLRCFTATCNWEPKCDLFRGNWGAETEIPCPADVI